MGSTYDIRHNIRRPVSRKINVLARDLREDLSSSKGEAAGGVAGHGDRYAREAVGVERGDAVVGERDGGKACGGGTEVLLVVGGGDLVGDGDAAGGGAGVGWDGEGVGC